MLVTHFNEADWLYWLVSVHDLLYVWYSLIKWHPLLVKSLHPFIQQLGEMLFKVIPVCAALLFFLIDFQYTALSSPLNALVPFYYMLMHLLGESLTSQCNGSMPMKKCLNLALIRCHIHSNNQEGELVDSWSADRWMAPVEVKCLAQRQLKSVFHSQYTTWVVDLSLTSLLL